MTSSSTLPSASLHGTYAVVTGASRGFGRAVAAALIDIGADVVGVARDAKTLHQTADELGDRFTAMPGDAADPALAEAVLTTYRPRTLVLAAGATPTMQPLQYQTWQSFSRIWDVDVQSVFHWTRQALLQPLSPGSTILAFSSGAAIKGSPLSGGYAGAKATIRFISSYAADESARAALGLRFLCVLPKLTPATDLGRPAVVAYAHRAGLDVESFLASFGPTSTPDSLAADVTSLVTDSSWDQPAYVLPPAGGPVVLA